MLADDGEFFNSKRPTVREIVVWMTIREDARVL
jgi:hypothetical protein